MRRVSLYLSANVVVLGLLGVVGCRDREDRLNEDRTTNEPGTVNDPNGPAASPDRPASVQAVNVKNSEAAAIVRTINQGEIDEANAVLSRLTSEPAKNLARLMLDEHTAAQKELTGILSSSGIALQENEKVRNLRKDSQDNLRELNEVAAKDLDMKYIDLQIEEHDEVLEMLDDKLIDTTNDPALSKFLRDQRGKIAGHLEHAKQAKEDLKARR